MATMIPNMFTSWELSEEEEIQGSILTITQAQLIQNLLASIAAEKNSLLFNVNDPQSFIQQEASLRGQMDILQYILDRSTASINLLNTTQPLDFNQ